MSQAQTPMETTQGYAPPIVTQFSVFLPNKVGRLLDLVESFDGSTCQICAISVHEASDCAIVRIITNCSNDARKLLNEQKLAFSETDLLVVELSEGHTLSSLCLSLLGAELNIQFAYPLMIRPNGTPTIALAVDDLTLAGQILRRKHFRLFGEGDLPKGR
ncbi:MAG: acetolactate synthase [Phycisphaerales bacterium]